MSENKPVQVSMFGVGESDVFKNTDKTRSTRALITEAEFINKEANIAETEWNRLKGRSLEYREALKKTSHMKWVIVDGERIPRDSVLAIVKFLDAYQSKKCVRVGRLREIIRELVLRGASVENFESRINKEKC